MSDEGGLNSTLRKVRSSLGAVQRSIYLLAASSWSFDNRYAHASEITAVVGGACRMCCLSRKGLFTRDSPVIPTA